MKHVYVLLFLLSGFAPGRVNASEDELPALIPAGPAVETGTTIEKPKPGSKRWLRSQKHTRNPRRKKYPKMRRWHTGVYDVTPVSLAIEHQARSGFTTPGRSEQNGAVVVYELNVSSSPIL